MSMEFKSYNTLKRYYEYRHEPEAMHVLADLYWRASLSIAALISACFVAYGLWQLAVVVGTNAYQGGQSNTTNVPLSRQELQSALSGLAARKSATETISAMTLSVPDPAVSK